MKIAIATGPWLPVPAVQGGAVHRLWQGLAEEFAAAGHQLTIVCRAYPGQPTTEVINGVRYIRSGGFSQSPNIWLDLLKDLLYAVQTFPTLPSADILITNDFWLPVFAALRPQAGKIVVNVNRFPKGQYPLYAGAARLIAVSRAIQTAIAQQYPPAIPRTRLIPNPIDTRTFSPPAQPRPERAEKVILYVGRLHPEKGVHLLLDAFSIVSNQIPTTKLRILGPFLESQGGGGESYLNQLKLKAEGLNVEFLAPIFDVEKLAHAYRSADVFCYPSLAEKGESFGVAPLEAMATGLVPIVSDLACFKDFIQAGKTGYCFDHRSSEAANVLATVLAEAILNGSTTRQMAENAAQAAANYSYQQVAKLYLTEFEALLMEQS
jgi:glycosyltransferase involved in cell wall biosynthesis